MGTIYYFPLYFHIIMHTCNLLIRKRTHFLNAHKETFDIQLKSKNIVSYLYAARSYNFEKMRASLAYLHAYIMFIGVSPYKCCGHILSVHQPLLKVPKVENKLQLTFPESNKTYIVYFFLLISNVYLQIAHLLVSKK